MAATLELKYFNTFWLKKIKAVTDVETTTIANNITAGAASTIATITLTANDNLFKIGAGQTVSNTTTAFSPAEVKVVSITGQTLVLASAQTVAVGDVLVFTGKADILQIPKAYTSSSNTDDWYIEEARIRGGYNNTSVDLGAKAYIVEDDPNNQNRFNALIYSGVFNSRTGVNDTNQFSVAQDITKATDPANGSIQKLYAEDTNLIIFQENKVSRALIDKDAIYSAEGNASITSSQLVIGQVVAYAGEYGISQDPFSFAVYGYRKYFTDRKRNAILRLSRDGITEISSYGMHDFFRDALSDSATNKVVGGWDIHNQNYVVSIQQPSTGFSDVNNQTVTFDESVLGWTSRFTYKPTFMVNVGANFFSYDKGIIYQQNLNATATSTSWHGLVSNSTVTVVLNAQPSVVKSFKTINYEGTNAWQVTSLIASSGDVAFDIGKYSEITNLSGLEADLFANNFKKKENKFFANILNNSPVNQGEVLFGNSISGLKGFFATVKLETATSNFPQELFAISVNTNESSY